MASIRIMMRGEMSGTLLLMEADGGITYPRQGTEQWDVILFFADGSWARCPCRNRDLRQVRAAALAVKDRFLSMGTVSGFFNWRAAHERFFRTKTEIRAEQAAQKPAKGGVPERDRDTAGGAAKAKSGICRRESCHEGEAGVGQQACTDAVPDWGSGVLCRKGMLQMERHRVEAGRFCMRESLSDWEGCGGEAVCCRKRRVWCGGAAVAGRGRRLSKRLLDLC